MLEPTPDISRIGPRDRLTLLESLSTHAGFLIYVEQLERMIEKDIDAKVWDTATPDPETRILREARKRLTDSFAPRRVLKAALMAAKTAAEEQNRAMSR